MNGEQLMQMQHMLSGCLNPDNAIRTAAEKTITDHLNQHREVFIYGLIKLIRTSPEANVRAQGTARTDTQTSRCTGRTDCSRVAHAAGVAALAQLVVAAQSSFAVARALCERYNLRASVVRA